MAKASSSMLAGKIAGIDKKIWIGGLVLAGIGVWWWTSQKKQAQPQPLGGGGTSGSDGGGTMTGPGGAPPPIGGSNFPGPGTGVPGNVITSVAPGPLASSGPTGSPVPGSRTVVATVPASGPRFGPVLSPIQSRLTAVRPSTFVGPA
jgi:hypothetical protein